MKNQQQMKLEELSSNVKAIVAEHNAMWLTWSMVLAAMMENEDSSSLVGSLISGDLNDLKDEITERVQFEAETNPNISGGPHRVIKAVLRGFALAEVVAINGGEPIVALLHQMVQSEKAEASKLLMDAGFDMAMIEKLRRETSDRTIVEARSGKLNSEKLLTREEAVAVLEQYGDNLTNLAADGKITKVIGRDDTIEQISLSLARKNKNSVVIVGEPGIGKTAIMEGLALAIHNKEVAETLQDKEVFSVDIGRMVAGTRFRGDFEERARRLIEAVEVCGNVIMFIDEIHMMLSAGSASEDGGPNMANLLKPALARGSFHCVGATTIAEYRRVFEKDSALSRRFQKLEIFEPSVEEAITIVNGAIDHYETHHDVVYEPDAITEAVKLAKRFLPGRQLPDSAFDVIDLAGARQKIAGNKDAAITPEMVQFEIAKLAKIPVKTLNESDREFLTSLRSKLRESVFGQDAAIDALVEATMISRSGLRDANKPAASFLFIGPTGVGKTEIVKQLADSNNVPLVRFDMSEYKEKHTVSKLIGTPPGYVGYGDGAAGSGLLINAIESNPHSVLLFDEVEKAHPEVMDLFLQILDEGSLKSANGKQVSFANTTIVMTSNAGSTFLQGNSVGFGSDNSSKAAQSTEAINKSFKPELRNRLDKIVMFNELSKESLNAITVKMVNGLNSLISDRNLTITATQEALDLIAAEGYDPKMGARPLARAIHNLIKVPLSVKLIDGEFKSGEEIVVDVIDGEVVLTTRKGKKVQLSVTDTAQA